MNALISSLYFQREEAERSVNSLLRIGIGEDRISIIMGECTRDILFGAFKYRGHFDIDADNHTGSGQGRGLLANLVTATTPLTRNLFCPGICLVGSGPLVTRLALLGSGGSARSFREAMHSMGVSLNTARSYVSGLRSRGIIVCADVSGLCATEVQRMVNFHSECACQLSCCRA